MSKPPLLHWHTVKHILIYLKCIVLMNLFLGFLLNYLFRDLLMVIGNHTQIIKNKPQI